VLYEGGEEEEQQQQQQQQQEKEENTRLSVRWIMISHVPYTGLIRMLVVAC